MSTKKRFYTIKQEGGKYWLHDNQHPAWRMTYRNHPSYSPGLQVLCDLLNKGHEATEAER